MKTIRIEISPALDQRGDWEEFTWDLVPVVAAEKTLHLQTNGLPKIGVHVPSGSILVGKIGKTKAFRSDHLPSSLEMHGLDFEALKAKYGAMWYDASFYATSENAGIVVDAYFETKDNRSVAVVMMDSGAPISDMNALGSGVPSAVGLR